MSFSTIVIAVIIGTCVGLDAIKKTKKAQANETPKQYNMEFEYRQISAKRCGEVNSMRIRDLSAQDYNTVLVADDKKFVTNRDETILFYRLFLSKPTDAERKAVYVCIREHQLRSLTVEFNELNGGGIYEDDDLLKVWNELLTGSTMLQSFINTGL